ncbi:TraR/DksA family transcriptional regulator [Neptunomonas qingdaonensis]|uniref:Transcriptional regulator, TraR/DksA family n=1 Tax=Neptunomonas qingdaonensis TaxID=1045558 RepID=A0A1I2UVJ6_9GAMM|nr:TraR/DksA family transcriptional regulator [Neptunomonas qingdaonensis]SFG80963.1 transcriptional regulator, TraR/DksA family [Neptunomonas qingdaonensis]
MSSSLTAAQEKIIKAELLDLLANLREDVGHELHDQQGERVHQAMKEAHDMGDEASADLESTINLVNMSRHLHEIKECQEALQRLTNGEYGLCVGCGEEIELNRLKANPVSSRCLSCQSKEEQQHPDVHHASL